MALDGRKSKKLHSICKKLLKKYKNFTLADIEPESVMIMWVDGGSSAKWLGRIRIIQHPYSVFFEEKYLIEINKDKISANCENKKQFKNGVIAVCYHELKHIRDDGKLKKHDIEDFVDILKAFGVGPYTKMPNLLKMETTEMRKRLGR